MQTRYTFSILLVMLMITGCGGYNKSYIVNNADQLHKDAVLLMTSTNRGALNSKECPQSFFNIGSIQANDVYVHASYVDILTDGWNPANGIRIYANTNYVPPKVSWNGKRTKQLALGIYRFEQGSKPRESGGVAQKAPIKIGKE